MMKKLLFMGFLLSSVLTINAQITSFESSEGYTLGNIVGQNGWGTNVPATTTNGPSMLVSSEYASGTGTNSFKLAGVNSTFHTLAGVFSPVNVVNGPIITMSMDIYFSSVSATGSDFQIIPQSPSQQKVSNRVNFDYQGNIMILDGPPNGTLAYVDSGADFVGGQWYNYKVVMNSTLNSITYYLNNNLIYTGQLFGATNIEQLVLFTDNYDSSAYFDNIQIISGVLNVNKTDNSSEFSIYPNPVNDTFTIQNGNNIAVSALTLSDINGRTVKTFNVNAIENQINISDLNSGVYFLNITSDKGLATKKIIKN